MFSFRDLLRPPLVTNLPISAGSWVFVVKVISAVPGRCFLFNDFYTFINQIKNFVLLTLELYILPHPQLTIIVVLVGS